MFFILRLFSFRFSDDHNIPFFYKTTTIIDEFFFFFFFKPLLGKRKTGKFYVNFFPLFLIKYYYFVKFKGSDLYPYNLDGNPRHQIHSFESHTLTEFCTAKSLLNLHYQKNKNQKFLKLLQFSNEKTLIHQKSSFPFGGMGG